MYTFLGTDKAKSIIDSGSNYLVYGDPDIDGMIAAYLVCTYLKSRNISYDYYINPNRKHGFMLPLDKVKGKTIIAVDFAMTEWQIDSVVKAGANIVLIDHHHTVSKALVVKGHNGCRGVLINNQYDFEDANYRFLSGAGVVYHVLGCIDSTMLSEDNKALVGITLLSDVREIENEYAKDFLSTTFKADTPMINRLLSVTKPEVTYGFGVSRMDRQFIDYTFSPRFNSMFRANKGYEAFEFMLGKPLSRDFIEECRQFQCDIVKYIVDNLKGEEYSDLICKYVDNKAMTDIIKEIGASTSFATAELSNYIGLVASRIKGNKCSMVYIKNGDTVERGSFRGNFDCNYLQLFRDLGGMADGHKNAFGFHRMISKATLSEFNDILHGMAQFGNVGSRVLDVCNLSTFVNTNNVRIAELNIYRRSSQQIYLKYSGSKQNCTCEEHGKMSIWKVDGVTVKSFDNTLTPWDNFILPYKDRGYTVFYLKKEF